MPDDNAASPTVPVELNWSDLAVLTGRHCYAASQASDACDTVKLAYHSAAAERFDRLAWQLLETAKAPAVTVLDPDNVDRTGQVWVPWRTASQVATHLDISELLALRRSYGEAAQNAAAAPDAERWLACENRRAQLLILACAIDPAVMASRERQDLEPAAGEC